MNNIEIDYVKPCIYQIKHKESGKIYIGSTTKGLKHRIKRHYRSGSKCTKLKNAIQKYGIKAFEVSIIEYCEKEIILEREQYYLDNLQPFDGNGYNICKKAVYNFGYTQKIMAIEGKNFPRSISKK